MVATIKLGKQGLVTTEQGFGGMSVGISFGPWDLYGKKNLSPSEVTELIKGMYAAGCNHIDTAQGYVHFLRLFGPKICANNSCFRHGEEIISEGIRQVGRDKLVIATKVNAFDGTKEFGSKENVKKTCDQSLGRLGISCIDLYYMHRVDNDTPIEVSMEAMKELIAEGKIKYVGISEGHPNTLRRAHKVCPLTCVQIEWSLWARDVEDEVVPLCKELGIGVVAYSPLGRGMLTGTTKRKEDVPKFTFHGMTQSGLMKNAINSDTTDKLKAIADTKGVTLAQLCLAWVHAKGQRMLGDCGVVPIPGTSKLEHIKSNLAAVALAKKLTDADLSTIEAAVPIEQCKSQNIEVGSKGWRKGQVDPCITLDEWKKKKAAEATASA